MNLVIVEDDINMRKSLEIALAEYEEFNIKSYKSATEALKKIDENTDLIIKTQIAPLAPMTFIFSPKYLKSKYT